ncbi:hypothetical protein AVEN_167897-1 [Araneus ventricosus]|uniref:Uncharacterized protein n=1 Tax=Araneus ventricosus TaxID=182803 RepID=A0A4Y2IRW6_ARAVE|nr:hypothetical protein AVEN_167897-1 [Araneus ventricosus]
MERCRNPGAECVGGDNIQIVKNSSDLHFTSRPQWRPRIFDNKYDEPRSDPEVYRGYVAACIAIFFIRLIDQFTSLKMNGKSCTGPSIGLTTIVTDCPYHLLLLEFPNTTKPVLNCIPVNHSTNHEAVVNLPR